MMTVLLLLLPPLLLPPMLPTTSADEESSDAYLRNVVSELRILNGLSPASESSSSLPPEPVVADSELRPVRWGQPIEQVLPPRPTVDNRASSEEPTVLGLTTRELAAMYRKAVELGSPMRYQALLDRLNPRQPIPHGTRFEFAADEDAGRPSAYPDSRYAYYYYPLQSFQHELLNQQGYQTITANGLRYDSAAAEDKKKETSTMSPVLVGISSFLGMAAMFVLSLFLYPRLVHYMSFPFVNASKVRSSELAYLSAFVAEAIEYYQNYSQTARQVDATADDGEATVSRAKVSGNKD